MIGEDGLMTEEAGRAVRRHGARGGAQGGRRGAAQRGLPVGLGALHPRRAATRTAPGQRIEPLISLQWFCDMEQLAGPAIESRASDGRVRFHPERPHTQVYLDWLENIRPWCVSRQLWWGHRIPAWYRGDEVHVGSEAARGRRLGARPRRARHLVLLRPVAVRHAGLARADRPAARVLPHRRAHHGRGTSSSSGWPGWSCSASSSPASVPFTDVSINSTIMAPDGRRMSKSLGTGIDPLDEIAEHGADAVRFGLRGHGLDPGRALLRPTGCARAWTWPTSSGTPRG